MRRPSLDELDRYGDDQIRSVTPRPNTDASRADPALAVDKAERSEADFVVHPVSPDTAIGSVAPPARAGAGEETDASGKHSRMCPVTMFGIDHCTCDFERALVGTGPETADHAALLATVVTLEARLRDAERRLQEHSGEVNDAR